MFVNHPLEQPLNRLQEPLRVTAVSRSSANPTAVPFLSKGEVNPSSTDPLSSHWSCLRQGWGPEGSAHPWAASRPQCLWVPPAPLCLCGPQTQLRVAACVTAPTHPHRLLVVFRTKKRHDTVLEARSLRRTQQGAGFFPGASRWLVERHLCPVSSLTSYSSENTILLD